MIKISLFLLFCAIFLGIVLQYALAAPDLLQQFPVETAPVKKRGAAQSQVALKGAFPGVAKSALKGAIDAKNLTLAMKTVGKVAVFSGTVVKVYAPKSGAMVLLNFDKNYKNALVGSVKARDFRRFPDLNSLEGQRVALRGKVVLYKGAPEIELSQSGAIRLVK